MPISFLTSAGDSRTQVPPHLQQIAIRSLDLGLSCLDKFVKGKVVLKGPLVSMDNGKYVLKTVIQELEHQQNLPRGLSSIGAVLFNKLARDFSEAVNTEDVVLMTGFTLAPSPTAHKDGLHSCNLQLGGAGDGGGACVYVCPALNASRSPAHSVTRSLARHPARASETQVTKYTYTALNKLVPDTIVNIYGVVTFFKQPYRSMGTDYCSFLKITDPSSVKVSCTVFQGELHNHPQVFRTGDIVRLHRVKAQSFRGSINVTTTHGFSIVVFDGTVGSPVVPRTSSRKLHFTAEDEQTVERLRRWASEQTALLGAAAVRLADVEPRMYFDFTCQLLAKAEMDRNCTLLKVWDGTECPYPLLDVSVEPDAQHGSTAVPGCRKGLVASVLVYDDHIKMTQDLKPGSYLRIYNLHAVPQTTSAASPSGRSDHLCFHLHGGTSYGRGLRILPKDSPDLQELQRALELLPASSDDIADVSLMDVWATPPESLEEASCDAERTCDHTLEQVPLSSVTKSTPPKTFHTRAQLKTFQPQKLFQCLKLYCPQCNALQNVPDEEAIGSAFHRAVGTAAFGSEPWLLTCFRESTEPGRKMAVHLPSSSHNDQTSLIFLEGAALEDVCQISEHRAVVPVRWHDGKMSFLDFSVPVFFQGSARHYGCRNCSRSECREPLPMELQEWDEKKVAEALGVQLLQYMLLMKLELDDGTDSLQALLWRDAEIFFGVSAQDTATDQQLQDRIQRTMDRLCPPEGTMETRPWLNLCLATYSAEEAGRSTVCYQVLNTKTVCPD
ncbi:protection of telomeres protein 1 [Brienomyrus brachyistius]|uniref:protection of telomeres protein 1 n=1 Tax=Brienomyrus brachyistius TaxID=42636 RepID=UPI0020B42CF8|nr:protection of telomeres protein 1 [Brienomyrus brachyistius]